MKIKSIEIGNFGKLQDYNINFEDGFNIIYGNNEDGKSTIMAFIKMMFYGSTGKSSDLSKNIRKKYMPWSGAKMSGAVEFEDKGINYRIEKIFGASNATDKINLWNKSTVEKERIASTSDIGERFFGIGAAAFEKSVFISQIGSTISSDGDRDDEITQKLLNLVSTGDENISHKKVDERLRSAKEALKSKSGRIGVLDKLNKKQEELVSRRIDALEDEEKKKQLEDQYNLLVQEEVKLRDTYEINKCQYNIQEKLNELEKLENVVSKKQYIDDLSSDTNLKKEQLKTGDMIFDNEFVKNCEHQITQIETLKRLIYEKNENAKILEGDSEKLKTQAVCEISKDYLEIVKAKLIDENVLQKSMDNLKGSIRDINEFIAKRDNGQDNLEASKKKLSTVIVEKQSEQKKLTELNDKVSEAEKTAFQAKENFTYLSGVLDASKKQKEKANTEYLVAVNNTEHVKQLSEQKVESEREKLKQYSTVHQVVTNENVGRTVKKPLLILSIVLLVLFIILGATINPILYVGVAVAIILSIAAFGKNKTKATITIIVDKTEIAKAEENLKAAESDKAREEQEAFQIEKMAEKAFKELESKVELLQKEVSKAEKEHIDSSIVLSNTKQQYKQLQVKLEFISEKVSAAEVEVTCDKSQLEELIKGNNLVADMDIHKLKLQLEEKIVAETELKDNIDKLLMAKSCKTIDELQNKHIEWQNYETKVIAKAEELLKSKCAETEAKNNLEFALNSLIQTVSQYTTVYSLDNAVKAVGELKDTIAEISAISIKINSQTEFLDNELQGKTVEQLKQNIDEVCGEVLKLNNGVYPEKYEKYQIDQLKHLNEEMFEQIQKIKEESIQLSSTIKNQFAQRINVSEADNAIHQVKEEILEKENYYQCLDIAESTINEAFNEISQSFGPLLNSKTTEIFNSLTDGKYQNVIISRNFDINVRNVNSVASYEWKYLSNGTIDQAYFALRLSISDLFSKESEPLPLMLDDVFLQYDENRAEQGLKFLADYSKKNGMSTQIIMFTCERSLLDLAKKNDYEISIKSITPGASIAFSNGTMI